LAWYPVAKRGAAPTSAIGSRRKQDGLAARGEEEADFREILDGKNQEALEKDQLKLVFLVSHQLVLRKVNSLISWVGR